MKLPAGIKVVSIRRGVGVVVITLARPRRTSTTVSTPASNVSALELTDEERAKLERFRAEGLLWLVNTAVLHPRGYAIAVHLDDDGAPIGMSVVGDGDEPWCFESEDAAESCAQFNAAELAREAVWAPRLRVVEHP